VFTNAHGFTAANLQLSSEPPEHALRTVSCRSF
jgi:hypothetical protein